MDIQWECEECGFRWYGDETDFECPCCDEINIKEVGREDI